VCVFFFNPVLKNLSRFSSVHYQFFWVVELRGHLSLTGAVCFVEGLRRYHPLVTMDTTLSSLCRTCMCAVHSIDICLVSC